MSISRSCLGLLLTLLGAMSAHATTLSLPRDSGAPPGSSGVASIVIDDAAGVVSADIRLTYDPSVALAVGVSKTELSRPHTLTVNLSQAGSIRISLFGTTPLSGGGPLLDIAFDSAGQQNSLTSLHFESASLNEGAIAVTLQDGQYCVQGLVGEVRNLTVDLTGASPPASLLAWDSDPFAVSYNVYRSMQPDLADLVCLVLAVPATTAQDDGALPPLGRAWQYLVAAVNCRGVSTLGFSSAVIERPRPPPCP